MNGWLTGTKAGRRWPLAVAALLVAAVVLSTGGSSARAYGGDGCVPVYGTFESQAVPPSECDSPVGFCTRGSLKGLLAGSYEFTMTTARPAGEPGTEGINFFTGYSDIHTRGGALLTGVDTGTIDLNPGRWGNFVSLITILDGTGRFEGARGQLALRGKVDLQTGGASGDFEAQICLP